jgi:hypothetical protein
LRDTIPSLWLDHSNAATVVFVVRREVAIHQASCEVRHWSRRGHMLVATVSRWLDSVDLDDDDDDR